MKSLIFCGGYGTRMNNGQPGKLKPLTLVAGKEILRHIMSLYEYYGIKEFILLGGYRISDLIHFAEGISDLKVHVLDTGESTPTGGRLLVAKDLINENESFLLTYGDSLTNFNLKLALEKLNRLNADILISFYTKKLEYGILDIDENDLLLKIHEKSYGVRINAGFYILNSNIFQYIKSSMESFEIDVLPRILDDENLKICAYEVGFWHPMDTPNDRDSLENILINNSKILFEN